MTARNIALLGDSVLNNYFAVNKDETKTVIYKLRHKFTTMAPTQQITIEIHAISGKTIQDVLDEQSTKISEKNTHICISVGGNDAINRVTKYKRNRKSISLFFKLVFWFFMGFTAEYKSMIKTVQDKLHPNCKILVCNLYKPNQDYGWLAPVYAIGRWYINWCISSIAEKEKLCLINLNSELTMKDILDIEPTETASEKIASAIFSAVQGREVKVSIDHQGHEA